MAYDRSVPILGVLLSFLFASALPHSQACFAQNRDPSQFYTRKATWQETLRLSREAAIRQQGEAKPIRPLPDFGRSDYTLTAWIRTTTGGTVFSISSANGVWAERGGKAIFVRNGLLGFDACCVGVLSGRTNVADGKWHHVAVTFEGAGKNRLTLYVDGTPDGGGNLTPDADVVGHILRIGLTARDFWPPNGFKGDLDEVRLYDKALTPVEIAASCKGPTPPAPDRLVACWTFDSDATDTSGNGRNGSLRNAQCVDGKVGKALQFNGQGSVEIRRDELQHIRAALWRSVERDFADALPRREIAWEQQDRIWEADWKPGDLSGLAHRYAEACRRLPTLAERAARSAPAVRTDADLQAVRQIYYLSRRFDAATAGLRAINSKSLRLAIDDLTRDFPEAYPKGSYYARQMAHCEKDTPALLERLAAGDERALADVEELVKVSREALLSNPLLSFDRLLVIKRNPRQLGLMQNWESNSSLPHTGYDNEISTLSPVRPEGELTPLFRPDGNGSKFVGDVDLHPDADRMLFSMPGANRRWQVFELKTDGTGLRQLPLIEQPDVDNYDACYLPNGNVIFCSTAPFVGVPCVTGSSHVCNLYLLDTPSGRIRRLTYEQDHDWCPTVLGNGRVLYLRWEYSDIPHYASRILFHMNPDGTEQMEYYGSNSYWPNAMFYARPVPNHPTKFVAVIGGHHGVPRMGELVLFDTAQGRREAGGVIQRIPGYQKKVEPIIRDQLVDGSWPKFLHPYPLSDKYFLVSAKPTPDSNWSIYLADVFDNMTLIKEVEGYALLEPVPFRKTTTPPVIPSRVQPDCSDALIHLTDIYVGNGLKGVPRGTVKKLRLFTYHFAYHGMGGQANRIGLDGPWDIKRIIGTVPVEPDGSASFRVPANTPISIQPLDGGGNALQLMRSWMTAMPGEVLSCVGCHESQNSGPPTRSSLASRRAPSEITPFQGPTRGFDFSREVQPVLDQYCVGCHGGQKQADGKAIVDFRPLREVRLDGVDLRAKYGFQFTSSYFALRRFVRAPPMESDMHLLTPCEYHADTTELVQILRKGHHGVTLPPEAWDRLITWIDLHTPAHGTWHEIVGDQKVNHQRDRRREMTKRYAGIDEDPEAMTAPTPLPPSPKAPVEQARKSAEDVRCAGWPFGADEAKRRQSAAGPAKFTVDLGRGVELKLVRIPAGEFIMGDPQGEADERPLTRVHIRQPFWMGMFEVTNEQYALFDPTHDSRIESGDFLHFSVEERGYPANGAKQPVVRVSWDRARGFCRWLSDRTGRPFTLPTEAEWEYACRAGANSPMSYGDPETDFSQFANLADAAFKHIDTYDPWKLPSGAIPQWRPAVARVNDKFRISAPVGTYQPNAWGLHDMHGNAWEWTRTTCKAYPYDAADGRDDPRTAGAKIVRGGSWHDRPHRARSASRGAYDPWRQVFNVGFRVICTDGAGTPGALSRAPDTAR